jgi:hypothetical protein
VSDTGGGRSRPLIGIVIGVVIVVALAATGFVYYQQHHKDYANLASDQGFLSITSNVTNFVQWQESGGVLTGTIQTTTETAATPADSTGIPIPATPASSSTVSQSLSGHVNGTHVVLTLTTGQNKGTTVFGTLGANSLVLTFPSNDSSCPSQGDSIESFRLASVSQFNDAPHHMSGVAPSCPSTAANSATADTTPLPTEASSTPPAVVAPSTTMTTVTYPPSTVPSVDGCVLTFDPSCAGDNLTGADLSEADFADGNLAGANLTNANLDGANIIGANTEGVTWSNTTCPDGTNSNNDGDTCVDNFDY